MRLTDVDIRLLMRPAHMPQAQRYMESARQAIKRFGLWYGRYPYPTLTVVDPASGGLGSGGMEYPTFITGGTHMLLNRWPLDHVHLAEEVTIHEFGHQYWYGMVGIERVRGGLARRRVQLRTQPAGSSIAFTGPRRPWAPCSGFASVTATKCGRCELASSHVRSTATARVDVSSPGSYGFYSYDRTDLTLRDARSTCSASR